MLLAPMLFQPLVVLWCLSRVTGPVRPEPSADLRQGLLAFWVLVTVAQVGGCALMLWLMNRRALCDVLTPLAAAFFGWGLWPARPVVLLRILPTLSRPIRFVVVAGETLMTAIYGACTVALIRNW
mgnify:FL=1